MKTNSKEFLDHLSTAWCCLCVAQNNEHLDGDMRVKIQNAKRYFSTYNAIELAKAVNKDLNPEVPFNHHSKPIKTIQTD